MQTTYLSNGCEVVQLHRPSREMVVTAKTETAEGAALAAEIINKGMRLNEDRKYTSSARMYARLESIAGYRELDDDSYVIEHLEESGIAP